MLSSRSCTVWWLSFVHPLTPCPQLLDLLYCTYTHSCHRCLAFQVLRWPRRPPAHLMTVGSMQAVHSVHCCSGWLNLSLLLMACRSWMFDQYSRIKGYSPAAVTGKVRCILRSCRTCSALLSVLRCIPCYLPLKSRMAVPWLSSRACLTAAPTRMLNRPTLAAAAAGTARQLRPRLGGRQGRGGGGAGVYPQMPAVAPSGHHLRHSGGQLQGSWGKVCGGGMPTRLQARVGRSPGSPPVWIKEALPGSVITVFSFCQVFRRWSGCRALESLAAGLPNTWLNLEGRWLRHRAPKPPHAATTGWTSLRSSSTCATAQGHYCRSSLEAKVGKGGGSAGHHLGYRGQGCKVANFVSLAVVVQQLRCNTSTVARRERCVHLQVLQGTALSTGNCTEH